MKFINYENRHLLLLIYFIERLQNFKMTLEKISRFWEDSTCVSTCTSSFFQSGYVLSGDQRGPHMTSEAAGTEKWESRDNSSFGLSARFASKAHYPL